MVFGVPDESTKLLPVPSMCSSSATLLKNGSPVDGHVVARLAFSASRNVHTPLAADNDGTRLKPMYPARALMRHLLR
jgi:hypothetical protein